MRPHSSDPEPESRNAFGPILTLNKFRREYGTIYDPWGIYPTPN